MIVKDEAPVIRRCLETLRPVIDHWVVVDTGSTDGTQDVVRRSMQDVPGELFERPWRDFAHNRSEALALSRDRGEYSLTMDADDTLELDPGFEMPRLAADSYTVEIADTASRYRRPQLVRNALPWRYEGVLHEFLTCEGAETRGALQGMRIRRRHDGARRKDPGTYRRDAELLERALQTEQNPFLVARYRFYLAQSYRDCGEPRKALENYMLRAGLGFWQEEVFVSLYAAAKLRAQLGHPPDEVIATFLRAAEAAPARAEALHGASRFCREKGRHEEGYRIAKRGLALWQPADGLFVEPWVYEYGLLDEFAVHAYWAGHHRESLDAALLGLASGKVPENHRERFVQNARFALGRLGAAAEARPAARAGQDRAGDGSRVAPTPKAHAEVHWVPSAPAGGTELMVDGLRRRLGDELDAVNLRVNCVDRDCFDGRPLVAWVHHDVNQAGVQWCRDKSLVERVAHFVFVSHWQRQRYLDAFGLPEARCSVLRNATEVDPDARRWEAGPVWRFAYTSTPFRGLSVLLDAWERLDRPDAELHVWSSMKIYARNDDGYEPLYARARSMPGVVYHGLAPNAELRRALRGMHFLAYPCIFPETSCLAAIEAMAAGCRLIVPSLGALPETAGDYARVYPSDPDPVSHARVFAGVLEDELARPWGGRAHLSDRQQAHCAEFYDWRRRLEQWRHLVRSISRDGAASRSDESSRSAMQTAL